MTSVRPSSDPAFVAAVRWLRQVDGRLLCRPDDRDGPDGWVALVKTPAATGRPAQIIVGFGATAVAAVTTAQQAWQRAWRDLSSVH
jgi:hypothetical protein